MEQAMDQYGIDVRKMHSGSYWKVNIRKSRRNNKIQTK